MVVHTLITVNIVKKKYSGLFNLKDNEDSMQGFHRWLKEHGMEVED